MLNFNLFLCCSNSSGHRLVFIKAQQLNPVLIDLTFKLNPFNLSTHHHAPTPLTDSPKLFLTCMFYTHWCERRGLVGVLSANKRCTAVFMSTFYISKITQTHFIHVYSILLLCLSVPVWYLSIECILLMPSNADSSMLASKRNKKDRFCVKHCSYFGKRHGRESKERKKTKHCHN